MNQQGQRAERETYSIISECFCRSLLSDCGKPWSGASMVIVIDFGSENLI